MNSSFRGRIFGKPRSIILVEQLENKMLAEHLESRIFAEQLENKMLAEHRENRILA